MSSADETTVVRSKALTVTVAIVALAMLAGGLILGEVIFRLANPDSTGLVGDLTTVVVASISAIAGLGAGSALAGSSPSSTKTTAAAPTVATPFAAPPLTAVPPPATEFFDPFADETGA